MENWHAIESLRWVGVLSLAVIMLSGIVPAIKAASSLSNSVSQSWALHKRGHWLMAVMLTVFGAGFCAFLVGWLIPTYHLWTGMYAITLAGYVALLGIGWFPMADKPGEHSLRHPHFIGGAAGACGGIVGYVAILLTSIPVPPVSHFVTVVALLYSVTWPAFFLRGVRNYFLLLEAMLVALFLAVIVSLTCGW